MKINTSLQIRFTNNLTFSTEWSVLKVWAQLFQMNLFNMFTKFSSQIQHLYCSVMHCLQYSTTMPKLQQIKCFDIYQTLFVLSFIIIDHTLCNKLIIVVCGFSAVEDFKQTFESVNVCMLVSTLPHISLQLYINLSNISECVMRS